MRNEIIDRIVKAAHTAHCSKCGKPVGDGGFRTANIPARGGVNPAYICSDCVEVGSYFDKNNNLKHIQAGHGVWKGFELECVPKSEEGYLAMLWGKYELLPTEDGSLPENGVEFKTPIYRNGSGIKSAIYSWLDWVDFSHPDCGQHINISKVTWSNVDYLIVRENADALFGKLREYMQHHPEDVVRVCGRNFCFYASDDVDWDTHRCFLNLSHDDRWEWRLAKLVSPDQYYALSDMVGEMLKCVETNYLNWFFTGKRDHKAEVTAKKLVSIFCKYAEGKAEAQKEKRCNASRKDRLNADADM